MSHWGLGKQTGVQGSRWIGGKGALTFQLHICQPVCRAENMSVDMDRIAVRGSCNRDRLGRPFSIWGRSGTLANTRDPATLGHSSVLGVLASLADSTNLNVSNALGIFSVSFNACFLEAEASKMAGFVLCLQERIYHQDRERIAEQRS